MLLNRTVGGLVVVASSTIAASPRAAAANLQNAPFIFDVRINLPLEPEEPSYHDFYINAGVEAGFKKGMYLTVVRMIPVHDPVQNKQQGTLSVGVARLQVIHVERQITVARLFAEFTDEDRPTLEFESVMIGDRIDPSSMTMEPPSSKKKQPKSMRKAETRAESNQDHEVESKPEPKVEAKAEPKPEPKTEPKPEPKTEPQAKNASPESQAPGMVRVPVPPANTREM